MDCFIKLNQSQYYIDCIFKNQAEGKQVEGKKRRVKLMTCCHACGAINPIDRDEQKIAKWIVSEASRSAEKKKRRKPKKKQERNDIG